jgi:hypothetical protein
MLNPLAEATAHLEKLETDRRAAMTISEQKAEEAKLIAARLEGFRAAMDFFAGAIPANIHEPQSEKSGPRRRRRDISDLVVRELSFSGQEMTTTQIAKAIAYIPEGTETVLKRLEKGGKVVQIANGRWVAQATRIMKPNGNDPGAGHSGRLPTS